METIGNIASTATTTVSNLIYGEQAQNTETGGKEPVSGEQGKGTVSDPYDQGNLPTPMQPADKPFLDKSNPTSPANATGTSPDSDEFLKLTPEVNAPKNEEDAPKIFTNENETTYTGMPVVPLTDSTTEGVPAPSTATTGTTGTSGAQDKDLKPTPFEDISKSGGTSPLPPAAAPVSSPDLAPPNVEKPQVASADVSPRTSAPPSVAGIEKTDTAKTTGTMDPKNPFGEEKPGNLTKTKTGNGEEKGSKMSHLKEKLKDKLHIGSKDK